MSARSPRSTERVIYRGGWELSYRCAVSPGTIDVLKDLGWEVVSDKAVQRLVFVQITVYERWEPSYQFRLHAQQPDMNVSVDYVLSAHDLAAIMLPLFKGKSSKHVENALESSSFIPQDNNGNDIVNRALRRWAADGWAPRRAYLIDWLLQRLRILEDNQGIVKLQLEPTQEQSKQWIEKETRRRFDALMGNKEMLMRNAKATEIQAIMRGHLARAEVKRIHEKYDQQLRDEKARMIQSTWKNHVGRKQLHRLYKCYMEEMKKQAAIIIQQFVAAKDARGPRETEDPQGEQVGRVREQEPWCQEHGGVRSEGALRCHRRQARGAGEGGREEEGPGPVVGAGAGELQCHHDRRRAPTGSEVVSQRGVHHHHVSRDDPRRSRARNRDRARDQGAGVELHGLRSVPGAVSLSRTDAFCQHLNKDRQYAP